MHLYTSMNGPTMTRNPAVPVGAAHSVESFSEGAGGKARERPGSAHPETVTASTDTAAHRWSSHCRITPNGA